MTIAYLDIVEPGIALAMINGATARIGRDGRRWFIEEYEEDADARGADRPFYAERSSRRAVTFAWFRELGYRAADVDLETHRDGE